MTTQTRMVQGAAAGTRLRIEVPEDQARGRSVIATANAKGDKPVISISCSGTDWLVSADGANACSATQFFAVDPGFSPWVEVTVDGPARGYDLALSVTTIVD